MQGGDEAMTAESTLLLTLVGVGAAWLFVHVVVVVQVLKAKALGRGVRALVLLPVATPVLGWIAGARVATAAWLALALIYVLLRLQAV